MTDINNQCYQQLFIVYGYNSRFSASYPTKYIFGTYNTIVEAYSRINTLCENTEYHISRTSYNTSTGWTYFINVIPMGDQRTEMFTTDVALK